MLGNADFNAGIVERLDDVQKRMEFLARHLVGSQARAKECVALIQQIKSDLLGPQALEVKP